jgi:hypothetical protein
VLRIFIILVILMMKQLAYSQIKTERIFKDYESTKMAFKQALYEPEVLAKVDFNHKFYCEEYKYINGIHEDKHKYEGYLFHKGTGELDLNLRGIVDVNIRMISTKFEIKKDVIGFTNPYLISGNLSPKFVFSDNNSSYSVLKADGSIADRTLGLGMQLGIAENARVLLLEIDAGFMSANRYIACKRLNNEKLIKSSSEAKK